MARLMASFSLAFDSARSVIAVKGPLRRFAPLTDPGRSEGTAGYDGKGGSQGRGGG